MFSFFPFALLFSSVYLVAVVLFFSFCCGFLSHFFLRRIFFSFSSGVAEVAEEKGKSVASDSPHQLSSVLLLLLPSASSVSRKRESEGDNLSVSPFHRLMSHPYHPHHPRQHNRLLLLLLLLPPLSSPFILCPHEVVAASEALAAAALAVSSSRRSPLPPVSPQPSPSTSADAAR